jgi:ornithine cyclodeaminase
MAEYNRGSTMHDDDILILNGEEVNSILNNRELELIDTVRNAYQAHALEDSTLPHSTFLRFPDSEKNRIIALPAYLGGDFKVAGVKWVSSFPDNINAGLDRASAAVILNSTETGRPEAFLEGSIISAKRTAASAALAARTLSVEKKTTTVGLIGCGLINYEIARFLMAALTGIQKLLVFDLDSSRANEFKNKCKLLADIEVEAVASASDVFAGASLISLATTAVKPHIFDISNCQGGSTILHVSLRDLSPEVILSSDNIVDDVDHVCRAQTSVHLAEQMAGDRAFIRGTLADILLGRMPARKDNESIAIFSPFGLGVLDVAVAKLVYDRGRSERMGTLIPSFLPRPWR